MTADHSQFSRELIEGLPPEERRGCIKELEAHFTARLRNHLTWDDYWLEVHRIIADLKSVGHDLWSHDYDGGRRHLYGWDYGRPEEAGYLQIQFDYEGPVRAFWRTENPRLGTTADEEDAEYDGGGQPATRPESK